MFGRGGRDGLSTTAILLFRQAEIKAERIEDHLRDVIIAQSCKRKALLQKLESEEEVDQGELPCRSFCRGTDIDPYGLFVYGRFPTSKLTKRPRVPVDKPVSWFACVVVYLQQIIYICWDCRSVATI